ncbi:MAG: Gfo/Idh/MocA family oxidoreductase [Minicystis sp.]
MIRAAVIGYGYWGPNIVRNFLGSGAIDLVAVCDRSPRQLARVREAYPALRTTEDPGEIFSDPTIDAVAVITPVDTHYALASAALRADKHVWIEKPITASVEEARRLCDLADQREKVLFVDHTFIYTGAVQKLRELVSQGELGKLVCYDSVRSNLGLYRPDVNVLWDLAVHDVSIVDYAFGQRVTAVSATGVANVPGLPESSAFMTAYLEGGAIMHVHADWFAPTKERTTTITGDRKMIVYDDNEPVEKVRVWDRGVDVTPAADGRRPVIAYRDGPATAPPLSKVEALAEAARNFAGSVASGERPLTDGALGLRVAEVLESAMESVRGRGRPVELSRGEPW